MVTMLLAGPVVAAPLISEFMASNEDTLFDEDGSSSDWIEIWNPDDEVADLSGLFLTDDAGFGTKWEFPPIVLAADERLVVFASGKDRRAGELHTNFKLSADGEYLGLIASDGETVVSDFGERFPGQFEDVSYGEGIFGVGYFSSPTPGAENSGGTPAGPDFRLVFEGAPRPDPGDGLDILAEVAGAASVRLIYKINFEDEVVLPMTNTGGLDYTARIPGAEAGDLIRWRYEATAESGLPSRSPAFRDRDNSPEFFGTVVKDPSVVSEAPVFEWFIRPDRYTRLLSFQTVRGGVYYLGEFYDNVEFTIHGQSTAFFAKKSFNIDFNSGRGFRWKGQERRVKDIDLIANWGDKSKSRLPLAFEVMRDAGVPTHFAFSVRVQQNGEFFSVADLVEDADDRCLERAGLNPDGVLYKAYDNLLRPEDLGGDDGMTKKTRKDEPNDDLHAFVAGINQEGVDRWDYIYDNVDLPMTINTLASLVINMQTDMFDKNYYLYRDTGGTNEWALLPWDMDLTFGRDFRSATGGYFDNNLYFEGYTEHEELADSITLVDFLIDGNEGTRAMFFRRLRTLSDEFLMSNYLEEKLSTQLAKLDPPGISPSDAQLDFEKWGSWLGGSPVPVSWTNPDPAVESMSEAVARFRDEWLPARRLEVANNVPDLPEAQNAPMISIGVLDDDPESDDQEEEYLELLNREQVAVDVSGWSVGGGIEIVLPPGTVIPAGGTLYLSPNVRAFRARDRSPTGGEQRFLVGPYSGKLSNDGETIDLYDALGNLQDSQTFSGLAGGFNGNGRVDEDGDGITALMEYAMGTSDEVRDEWAVPTQYHFTYREGLNTPELSLQAEISSDLQTWTRQGVNETSRVPMNATSELVTVSLPQADGPCFVRLVVVRP